ncbi:diguanylate cyclase (GGDEF) domain-containing protein [Campylobacter sp. 10_1_50]|nr:diguanylate cyclase (GGDEF) domain-containing protein [Campylobacter sp. 10_1_50]
MVQEFIEQDSYKAIDDIYKTILNVAIVSNLIAILVFGFFGESLLIVFICLLFFCINIPLRLKFDVKKRHLISALFHINTTALVIAGVINMGWGCGIWITLLGVVFINYFLSFKQKIIIYIVSLVELFVLIWLYFSYKDSQTIASDTLLKTVTFLSICFTYYIVIRLSSFADAITSSNYIQITNEKINIEENAKYDFLTGLLNRRSIEKILKYELNELIDKYNDTNLIIMLGDIDNFKQINDTYGHSVGDEILKNIAKALKDTFRENDYVCRWGGEEFLAILPNVKTNDVKKIENRLNARIAKVKLPNQSVVTMTFGLVLCANGVNIDIKTVIDIADKKLYNGKKNGKDRIEYAILKKGYTHYDNA